MYYYYMYLNIILRRLFMGLNSQTFRSRGCSWTCLVRFCALIHRFYFFFSCSLDLSKLLLSVCAGVFVVFMRSRGTNKRFQSFFNATSTVLTLRAESTIPSSCKGKARSWWPTTSRPKWSPWLWTRLKQVYWQGRQMSCHPPRIPHSPLELSGAFLYRPPSQFWKVFYLYRPRQPL